MNIKITEILYDANTWFLNKSLCVVLAENAYSRQKSIKNNRIKLQCMAFAACSWAAWASHWTWFINFLKSILFFVILTIFSLFHFFHIHSKICIFYLILAYFLMVFWIFQTENVKRPQSILFAQYLCVFWFFFVLFFLQNIQLSWFLRHSYHFHQQF